MYKRFQLSGNQGVISFILPFLFTLQTLVPQPAYTMKYLLGIQGHIQGGSLLVAKYIYYTSTKSYAKLIFWDLTLYQSILFLETIPLGYKLLHFPVRLNRAESYFVFPVQLGTCKEYNQLNLYHQLFSFKNCVYFFAICKIDEDLENGSLGGKNNNANTLLQA